MRVAIFALLLLAALGYAAWRGGGPERVMTGIAAAMVGSDLLLHQFVAPEYAVLDFGHLLIDGFGASATLLLALFAYRFWPMIAAVLHILPLLAHSSRALNLAMDPAAYMVMQVAASWAVPPPPVVRNLAAPETALRQRQLSVLAQLIATIVPESCEELAGTLLGEFGSLDRIWAQTPEGLARILGDRTAVIDLILCARRAMLESMRGTLHSRRIDPDDAKLRDYLIASMGSLADEHLRILFLDGSRQLIADECLQSGTLAHLALYPRVIFRRALEHNAAAIILVHNHPSGDPRPSDKDIDATRRIEEIGRALDIQLMAHIVVTASQTHRISGIKAAPRSAGGFFQFILKSPESAADRRARAEQVLTNARIAQRRRVLRRQLIGAEYLFVEPAWDMLLDLFIHQCEGRVLHLYPMCVASGIPMSSALRLAQKLCEAGILRRRPDMFDGRRSIMTIEPEITHRLSAYFAEGAE